MKKNVLKFPPLTADDIDSFPDFRIPGPFGQYDTGEESQNTSAAG